MTITNKQIDNFWKKVSVRGINDCWEWLKSRSNKGYGRIFINSQPQEAHRISYEISNQLIPEKMWVLHKCDNRKCVNPNHLWLGTAKDNSDDMIAKGRDIHSRGERHPQVKLSGEDVKKIQSLYKNGNITQMELAKLFKVKQVQISRIINKKTWRHIFND